MRLPLAWLAVSVVAVIVVSALQPPDVEAIVNRLLLVGWIGFWCLVFGIWLVQVRRGVSREAVDRYLSLALTTPSARASASFNSGTRISLAYLAFCAVVVAFGTVAFITGGNGPVLYAMVGFVVLVGLPLMFYALRTARADMSELMAPLGLEVSETPSLGLTRGLGSGRLRVTLDGAQVFAGERHGRVVNIAQRPGLAVTLVEPLGGEPWSREPVAPDSTEALADLIGAPADAFVGVTVTASADGVRVERRGNAAAASFLLDLALAEKLAGS